MAGNFNISISKTGGRVHLKLDGDFDGSSACELLNVLNSESLSNSSKILVDTDSLKHVHPFGLDVLHNRLPIAISRKLPLIFTGKKSNQFGL